MTRLIDADALKDDILKSAVMIDDTGIQTGYEIAIELIKRQPTVEAVPIEYIEKRLAKMEMLKDHTIFEQMELERRIRVWRAQNDKTD